MPRLALPLRSIAPLDATAPTAQLRRDAQAAPFVQLANFPGKDTKHVPIALLVRTVLMPEPQFALIVHLDSCLKSVRPLAASALPGKYAADKDTCLGCPSGYYQPSAGKTKCEACKPGTAVFINYTANPDRAGATKCDLCSPWSLPAQDQRHALR